MSQLRNRSDFAIVVPSYLDDYGLDPYEYRLYTHIARRAGKNGCWESIPNMAKHCLMNEKTVRASLRLLLDAKLIGVVEAKKGKSIIYEITPHEEWAPPEQLPIIRSKRTPNKSGTTTPTKSGTTTPTKLGTTTPTKSGTTTPTKSGTTPLPNLAGEVFQDKEVPIKEIPLSVDRAISPPPPEPAIAQKEISILEANTQSLPLAIEIESDISQTQKLLPSGSNSAAPALNSVEKYRSLDAQGVKLSKGELRQWANGEIGEAVRIYRKSGYILTGGNDVSGDFAVFVGRRNSSPQTPKTDLVSYGFNIIRNCENNACRWQELAVWAYEWRQLKEGTPINVAQEAINQQESQERKQFGQFKFH